MKILALEKERPGAPTADASLLKAEAQAVWDLVQIGAIREIHFRDDRPQAVVILEAESPLHAQATLAQLPLVRAELVDFEVIGLLPYPGFSRLFGP